MEFMILVGFMCIPAAWAFMWFGQIQRNDEFIEWLDSFLDVEWETPIDYTPIRDGEAVE